MWPLCSQKRARDRVRTSSQARPSAGNTVPSACTVMGAPCKAMPELPQTPFPHPAWVCAGHTRAHEDQAREGWPLP